MLCHVKAMIPIKCISNMWETLVWKHDVFGKGQLEDHSAHWAVPGYLKQHVLLFFITAMGRSSHKNNSVKMLVNPVVYLGLHKGWNYYFVNTR